MTSDYHELLGRDEWKKKRQEVLDRASHKCEECGRDHYQRTIDVHHRYYRLDWLPWDYPDGAFVALCREDHEALHRRSKIPVFDQNGQPLAVHTRCRRCEGAGYIPAYRHISDGICFGCWGSGIDFEKILIGRTQAQIEKKPNQALQPTAAAGRG